MKYRVTIATSYEVEANDGGEAIEIAEKLLKLDLKLGWIPKNTGKTKEIFGFNASLICSNCGTEIVEGWTRNYCGCLSEEHSKAIDNLEKV